MSLHDVADLKVAIELAQERYIDASETCGPLFTDDTLKALKEYPEALLTLLDLRKEFPDKPPTHQELASGPFLRLLRYLHPYLYALDGPESTDFSRKYDDLASDLEAMSKMTDDVDVMASATAHPVSDQWVKTRYEAFQRYFNRTAQKFYKWRCEYYQPLADEDDKEPAKTESDNCEDLEKDAEELFDMYKLRTKNRFGGEPWYNFEQTVAQVVEALCNMFKAFVRFASLFFHTRDLFIFSRFELYSLLCHILLRLQFPALAEYVLSMPCFTIWQQDLLQIAYAAVERAPNPELVSTLCAHGIIPLDALRTDSENRLRLHFFKRRANPRPEQRDECIELVRAATKMQGFTGVASSIVALIEAPDRLVCNASSALMNFSWRNVQFYTQGASCSMTMHEKYMRAELWCNTNDDNSAETLQSRTWQLALASLNKRDPLFFRLSKPIDTTKPRINLTPLISLYTSGQLIGIYKPTVPHPDSTTVMEAQANAFSSFLYANTAVHPGVHGRTCSVRAFYDAF